jgi:hypothetical protein
MESRDSKPVVLEEKVLVEVSEEALVVPMQNNEAVRPVEVVEEEVDHVHDEGLHVDVLE